MVRAKFKVVSITRSSSTRLAPNPSGEGSSYQDCELRTVKLTPVYSNDPEHENKKWWDATPCGQIELGCANLAAAAAFELNAEYFVDFTPAVAPAAETAPETAPV